MQTPFTGMDNRGVSPVLATLFMIGITIVAVGSVGILVLDIGNDIQDPPAAAAFSFSYEQNDTAGYGDELLITHIAGSDLPKETIEVQYENVYYSYGGESNRHRHPDGSLNWAKLELEDQSAGDTVSIDKIKQQYMEKETGGNPDDAHLHLTKATIRIVWHGGSGSVIIDEWSGPDA